MMLFFSYDDNFLPRSFEKKIDENSQFDLQLDFQQLGSYE